MGQLCFVAERGTERFEIVEIVEAAVQGFYVFRYADGWNTHDYLQDDLEMAYQCAEVEWGLPKADWREAAIGE